MDILFLRTHERKTNQEDDTIKSLEVRKLEKNQGQIIQDFIDFLDEMGSEALESFTLQNPTQGLKSKIESLIRSLENLSAKKLRIEFEIKRQKRALASKREELKRNSKSSQAKLKVSLESYNYDSEEAKKLLEDEYKRTQLLLQKSSQILEE